MINHPVKLYLDADITSGPLLASILRQRSFDVISAIEVGNSALLDSDQLAYAVEQQRTLLTFNTADFVTLGQEYYTHNRPHYGIIVSPQLKKDQFGLLLQLILSLLNHIDANSLKNTIRFLQEFR